MGAGMTDAAPMNETTGTPSGDSARPLTKSRRLRQSATVVGRHGSWNACRAVRTKPRVKVWTRGDPRNATSAQIAASAREIGSEPRLNREDAIRWSAVLKEREPRHLGAVGTRNEQVEDVDAEIGAAAPLGDGEMQMRWDVRHL